MRSLNWDKVNGVLVGSECDPPCPPLLRGGLGGVAPSEPAVSITPFDLCRPHSSPLPPADKHQTPALHTDVPHATHAAHWRRSVSRKSLPSEPRRLARIVPPCQSWGS